jgi:dTDP-4-dehydrorhamnose 3,5-epimerase
MRVIETNLPGVLRVIPDLFKDPRGFFMETYHAEKFKALGLPEIFLQDNHSRSGKGILRGLHFQKTRQQGKLVRVVAGSLFDVAVDIRQGSPTFGQWYGQVLTSENPEFLYIPEGFAHGFYSLEENTELVYKCTELYDPSDEGGILWSDPDIGIDWPGRTPTVSAKDALYPLLKELSAEHLPKI